MKNSTTPTIQPSSERVREVVEELLPRLRTAFNLHDWDINVIYSEDNNAESEKEGVKFVTTARVHLKPEYLHVALSVFPAHIDSEDDLRKTITHEMLHVTQWPLFNYAEVMTPMLSGECQRGESVAWRHAIERHVQDMLRWPHIKALYAAPTPTDIPRGIKKGPGGGKSAGKVAP